MAGKWIDDWEPDDERFWESTGKRVARRNLSFSIFAELLGFSIWVVWGVVAVKLNDNGFDLSTSQLFWLVSVPGLIGATMRFPYTFMPARIGGRNWTIISALLLLIPTVLLAVMVRDPSTPYALLLLAAATAGFGGGNFSSSMANISYFYPEGRKGLALGLNAAGGNVGVAITLLMVPLVVGAGGLELAGLIWILFVLAAVFLTMAVATLGVIFFIVQKAEPWAFTGFLATFIVLFILSGLANGSTFRMVPAIWRAQTLEQGEQTGEGREEAIARSRREGAAVLGFIGAVAAYGGFVIPQAYNASISLIDGPEIALAVFCAYYVFAAGVTWRVYLRRKVPAATGARVPGGLAHARV